MVVDIREICGQDKSQWLQLWQGYTSFYGSPQPDDVTEYTWQRLLDHSSPVLWLTIAWWDSQYAFSMKGPG